jgi:hypothetical protein
MQSGIVGGSNRANEAIAWGSIDVHTGVGNFLSGVTPNQDMLTDVVGGDDAEERLAVVRGGFVRSRKRAFFGSRLLPPNQGLGMDLCLESQVVEWSWQGINKTPPD